MSVTDTLESTSQRKLIIIDRVPGLLLIPVDIEVAEVQEDREGQKYGLPSRILHFVESHVVVVQVRRATPSQATWHSLLDVSHGRAGLDIVNWEIDLSARATWQWAPETRLAATAIHQQNIFVALIPDLEPQAAASTRIPEATNLVSRPFVDNVGHRPVEAATCQLAKPVQCNERARWGTRRCARDVHFPGSTIAAAHGLHLSAAAVSLLDCEEMPAASRVHDVILVSHLDLIAQ